MTEKKKKRIAEAIKEMDRLAKETAEARRKIPGADKFNSTEALMRFRYGKDGSRRKRHA